MTSEKKSKVRNTETTQAPEPPSTISGTGSTMSSKRPDWNFWNKLPALSINECVMLLINVEPQTFLSNSKKHQYDRVCRRVQSFQAVDELPSYGANIAPSEFIAWAQTNDEEPPDEWDPIQVKKKQEKAPEAETQAVDDAPKQITPSDKRRKEGLRAAKTILIQNHSIGKLRDKSDFKKYMKKAAVIEYIREQPATFPHCAETAPVLAENQCSVVARREPTLAKDFPDFTKHPEILAEYKKLISEE